MLSVEEFDHKSELWNDLPIDGRPELWLYLGFPSKKDFQYFLLSNYKYPGQPTKNLTSPNDPAFQLLTDSFTTKQTIFRKGCFICEDPEFAQMGLPLCYPCKHCTGGHVPADDPICDDCGVECTPYACTEHWKDYPKS